MTKDKMKMGYIEVETQKGCNLFPAHCKARGHVYHFSEILQEKVVGGFTHGPGIELQWQTGYHATMQVGLHARLDHIIVDSSHSCQSLLVTACIIHTGAGG